MKVTLNFSFFQEDTKMYIKSLFTSYNKKAIKTLNVCSLLEFLYNLYLIIYVLREEYVSCGSSLFVSFMYLLYFSCNLFLSSLVLF